MSKQQRRVLKRALRRWTRSDAAWHVGTVLRTHTGRAVAIFSGHGRRSRKPIFTLTAKVSAIQIQIRLVDL